MILGKFFLSKEKFSFGGFKNEETNMSLKFSM